MQYKTFSVSAIGGSSSPEEEAMNSFLRGHRVLGVSRELVSQNGDLYWCFCVEYLPSGEGQSSSLSSGGRAAKVDYGQVLSKENFAKFRILRECRKIIATEEAIPAYAIFVDEQLAKVAELPELSLTSLGSVSGVGQKKIAKYGARFLALWEEKSHAAGGESLPENSTA